MNWNRSTALLATIFALGIAGCSTGMPVNTITPVVSPESGAPKFSGVVHGGQSPIVGATVGIWAVNESSYGGASTEVDNGTATTGTNGGFNFSANPTCPDSNSLIYVVSTGGVTDGSSPADNTNSSFNTNAVLMTALGNCVALLAQPGGVNINMNELTTVVAAYALAPFATTSGIGTLNSTVESIGAPFSTNLSGIVNAFAEANNIVKYSLGGVYASTSTVQYPIALVGTIGDAIATCVNSTPLQSPCGTLFGSGYTKVGSVTPADTFAAAIQIARNPSNNVANINNLTFSSPAFGTFIGATPNDFTMAVKYSGNGISAPKSIAIDAAGNAWIASANNAVTALAAGTGTALLSGGYTTSGSLDAPQGIAIDTAGNVWVANCGSKCSGSANASSVTVLVPNSTSAPSSITTAANQTSSALKGAYGLAIDGSNHAWVANALGTALTTATYASSTVTLSSTSYAQTYLSGPSSVTIDGSGHAWAVSPATNAMTKFTYGTATGTSAFQGTGLSYPAATAIDKNGYVWALNQSANTVSVVNGTSLVGTYSGGGLATGALPNAIAFDGASNAWISNANGSVSEFTYSGTAVTPTAGYLPAALQNAGSTYTAFYATGVAVDRSGTVWVTSCGTYCGVGTDAGSVYQIIGAATPVITPLASAVAANEIATAP